MSSKDGKSLCHMGDVRRWVEQKSRLFPLDFSADEQGQAMTAREDFGSYVVVVDGYWTRFWSRNSYWKGQRCRFEEAMRLPRLPECAEYCWKLLMFRKRSQEVWESMEHLLPLICQGEIGTLKHNGDRLAEGEQGEYVIVIYTWGQAQRDKLKQRLHAVGFTNVPWRRGCEAFEKRFGPWRTWFKS